MAGIDSGPGSAPALDARGLVKRFGAIAALDGLDLRVERGEVRGLVGPNGAGKTTLLRTLFGLIQPDSGSIRLLDRDWNESAARTVEGVAGFVEDPRCYPYLSARRNLELLAILDGDLDRRRVAEALETVGLTDRSEHKVGGFSSGMRQRLGLAASLLRYPLLLLLDEPTVGLDPTGARDMRQLIRGLASDGTTVVLSSHNMDELDGLCDSVTVIRSGRAVWDGSMERLRAEAPAPANRMWTSDDARVLDIAASDPNVMATPAPEGGLVVSAERAGLDGFVITLGRAGIAVRRLELLMTALESLFYELTGERGGDERTETGELDGMRVST